MWLVGLSSWQKKSNCSFMEDRVIKKGNDTPWNAVDDEVVLLNLDSGYYYSLNESGRRIWELIDGKNKISDIARIICEEYDVKNDDAIKDVNVVVDELLAEGWGGLGVRQDTLKS
jgi:trimethylamine:corrinoid methyltransferase-like protein